MRNITSASWWILLICAFTVAAPGTAAAQESPAEPDFVPERGFFDAPVEVRLSSATAGAVIRYTTDGSAPTATSGMEYSTPLLLDSTTVVRAASFVAGTPPSRLVAHTYLFPHASNRQPFLPSGFPVQWRASNGTVLLFPADYEMDPEYPESEAGIVAALLDLPTVSVSMDPDSLFGRQGIYNNGGRDNNAQWERPGSVEMIFPDGTEGFQVNAGLQPRSHRPSESPKRGMRVDFKSEYGVGRLDFPVFDRDEDPDRTAQNSFNSLILRSGYMENYTGKIYNPVRQIYFRDPMVRDAQRLVSGYGTHNRFVHLYLNGLYWGIYDLTEAIDADFLADYLGGPEDDWFIAKSHADSDDDGEFVTGDPTRYRAFLSFISTHDLADPTNYATAVTYIDPAHFADYIIIQCYYAVGDWPNNNWVFVMKNGGAPEPGRFFVWDAEKTWLIDDDAQSNEHAWYSPYLWDTSRWGSGAVPPRIWRAMIANADFRMLFADRVYRHLYNNGPLTNDRAIARFDAFADRLDRVIRADQKRWSDDDNRNRLPGRMFTHQDWIDEVQRVRANIQDNVAHFVADFSERGLYPDLVPPVADHATGSVTPGEVLRLDDPNLHGSSTIAVTLDGSDPRMPGGTRSPSAVTSRDSLIVTLMKTTTISARVQLWSRWSPLFRATYFVEGQLDGLRITEIMYHPPAVGDVDGDEYEFIELKNAGSVPVNLSGAKFSDGITYAFPDGAVLEPGAFLVLASNAAAFEEKYGFLPYDTYPNRLSNAGERIALSDGLGSDVIAFTYDDAAPWPENADGTGYSIVLRNPTGNPSPDDASSWQASSEPGGTPGADDPGVTAVDLNELPAAARLDPPYPNPFRSTARMAFAVDRPQHVRIVMYDVLGRRVAVLSDGTAAAGDRTWVTVDGTRLSAGVYLVRLEGEFAQASRQILLLR